MIRGQTRGLSPLFNKAQILQMISDCYIILTRVKIIVVAALAIALNNGYVADLVSFTSS